MKFFFVGERPSKLAKSKGLTLKDGKLAGKQLFDALRFCSINPESCRFDNIFNSNLDEKEKVCRNAKRRVQRAYKNGYQIVVLGNKVETVLKNIVDYKKITHPAARGKIRKKELYCKHVLEVLK